MNRLTKKFPGGYGLVKVKDNEQDIESPYPNTLRACFESWQRLGAYEDTGLTPNEIVAFKAKLVKFSEAYKGAQAVCEVAISEKKQAIAERDRFKARAEALESEVLARGCITCKHRGTRSLTMPCARCNMASEWEWRGPQEGAADVECSAKPEASKENTRDFYGIIMDNVVDHIQQCYTKETVTLSDGTRAVIRRWKPFPDMTKEGENG